MLTALLCLFATPAAAAQATHHHITVVDDATGAPIVGARVLGVEEAHTPVWGERRFRVAVATSAEGKAALPRPTEDANYSWMMVEAAGYGTWATMVSPRSDESEVRLLPEVPITIEVLDYMGSPLPLAHLGVCFGCGHTPDLISAFTGPDGRATLRGVRDYDHHIEDLYVVHAKTSMNGYDSVPYGDVVDGVARFYAHPGTMLEGQVLLPDGKPAIGYGVGNNETHRGHWAVTDERGRFRLYGAEPRPEYLRVMTPGGEWIAGFDHSRAGVFRTLALDGTDSPDVFEDGLGETKRATRKVEVQVNVAAAEGPDVANRMRWIPVEIWDPKTGQSFFDQTDEAGAVTFRVPAGEYRVEVGGPECAFRARELEPLVVATDGSNEALQRTCELEAPRVCMIDVTGLREGEGLALQTAGGYYLPWSKREKGDGPIAVALPSGRFSAHFMRRDAEEIWRRVQVDLPLEIGAQLTIRCPK